MENKETKNNKAEELDEEALGEVTGGANQLGKVVTSGAATASRSAARSVKDAVAGSPVTVPGVDTFRPL